MTRKFLSIAVGILAGAIVIALVEMICQAIYPLPQDMDISNPLEMAEYVRVIPIGALLIVLLGWALGAIVSGLIASLIMKESKGISALICGAALLAMGIVNMMLIPHPIWFWFLGVLIFLPSAWVGFLLVDKKRSS